MRLHEWERELGKLETELSALCVAAEPGLLRARSKEGRTVHSLRDSVAALQAAVGSLFDKLRRTAKMDVILLPREKALVHFTGILVEKLRRLDEVKTKYQSRLMWLQLIHTRLSGEDPGSHVEIQPEELVKLAVREADLEKTERLLADALVKHRQEKRRLFCRYNALDVEEANLKAARSMHNRFGQTWSEAASHASLVALEQYVNRLVRPVRSRRLHRQLKKLQHNYESKTREIMGSYQAIMIDRLNGRDSLDADELKKFETTMRQLNALQRETKDACDKLFGNPTNSASKQMRSLEKRDTTIV